MIQIKTQELRDAVQATYEFDKEHGKYTDESTGQFTGNFYHETYEFDGKSKTYYFDPGKLFAYEDVV